MFIRVIVFLILLPGTLLALESDDAKFLAKDREATLRIVNYKTEQEAKKKADKERKARKKKQRELRAKRKQELALQTDKKHRLALEKQAELERDKQAKKLAAERRKQEELEAMRRRQSSVKLVKAEDKDKIDFTKKPSFYMEDYSEVGIAEDRATSVISRDNIVTTTQYIRLLLDTSINSRRGGRFIAIVEKDVYSLDVKKVLIGKGSKFVCSFKPLNRYGETALQAKCTELHLSDGRFVLLNSPLIDGMGRAGISGEVDNRTWAKYGQTFMLGVLGGVAMLGADKIPNNDIGSVAQYTALNVVDTATQILDKTVDLAPIVIIPSGTRIYLIPTIPINLKPHRSTNIASNVEEKKS